METSQYLRTQAYNNAFSNHRLLKACGQLPESELFKERTGFFPSIIHTLNHILTVDWFYVSGLEGACVGYKAFDPEIPCTEFVDLDREQRAIDKRLITVCDKLTDACLSKIIHLHRKSWVQAEPLGRVLLHLFQHQIHHRGQVHTMLSATDVRPPQLDEFFLGHEKEKVLRAKDFAELGFSEEEIWL